jgi:hypothetical protein
VDQADPAFQVDILSDHLELFGFHDEFEFSSRERLLIRWGTLSALVQSLGAGRSTSNDGSLTLRPTCSMLLDAKGSRSRSAWLTYGVMQLHHSHVGRDRLREISQVFDRGLQGDSQ